MGFRKNIVKQFRQPKGVLGQLAGFVMANRPSNIERNAWTLGLLSLREGDRLLEIGYGPGIAIEKASQVISGGLIVGIDHSETMLAQARKRNAMAIDEGLVQLYCGSVEELPAFDKPFDKIFSANVVQFWPDPVSTFRKLRSMLAADGVIASTYMPRNKNATDADALNKANQIVEQLRQAGFSSISVETKQMSPVSTISVLARNT